MTRSSLSGLDALLQRPSCGALSAPLRQALLDAWQLPDADVPPRQPWPVLADTLDSLALLSADEAVVVAALLFDLPG
ncbi:MAG: GTP diphosphokinase, partial [Stenotrophomonas sp.]